MNSSLALLISIVVVLLLVRKTHPSIAVFVGATLLSLLCLPWLEFPEILFKTMTDWQTLRLILIVASAMTMSAAMEVKGLLTDLAKAMEVFGSKKAVHIVPAMIGLVPMPAGALVSATAVRSTADKLSLKPEEITFINYWFRHIWEFSMPMYQSVILASVVLSQPLSYIFLVLFPLTIFSTFFGLLISKRILSSRDEGRLKISLPFSTFLRASWPILLLVIMVLIGLDPAIAFPISLFLLLLQQRFRLNELKKPLKYGLNPKIIFLLYAIMVYKLVIGISGAAHSLFEDVSAIGMPIFSLLIIIPFILSFAIGQSLAFAGLAFPLLLPILVQNGLNLGGFILAYTSGMNGMLLSPLHLCLVLTSSYFGAKLTKVYGYVLPLVLAMEAVALISCFML